MLWMAYSYNVKNSTYPLRSHSRKLLENKMKMFLLAWKGLLASGEQEKPEPSSVAEIACHLWAAGQPLTPLLALDEDLLNPCKHADTGALQESEEKIIVCENSEAGLLQEGQETAVLKPLPIPHNS